MQSSMVVAVDAFIFVPSVYVFYAYYRLFFLKISFAMFFMIYVLDYNFF